MKALVCVGPPNLVELREVKPPFAEHGDAVVRVEAVSVNRGELHRLMSSSHFGWQPGWDFAGVVVRAPGGTIPAGGRVCGLVVEGSWAEQLTVPTGQLARIPDNVSSEAAAALPVAGLTALRVLRLRGDLAGQSVLVQGAAGGVGRFAVQLARRAGAHVIAVVGSPDRARGVLQLGAHEVVHSLQGLRRRYDLILESVGGSVLCQSIDLLAPGGLMVCFGSSSQAETTLSIADFYSKQATIRGFYLLYDIVREAPAADLEYLLRLSADGELVTDVAAVADWTDAATVLGRLRARQIAGKAVLRTCPPSPRTPGATDE
ncbi:zinc-binding dehydrogenase [Micromonospora sp. Llam7]|uniref:zinc-binding dehydrogenase n=1 Tax=Micromonospora tarapacensis TaxID=2835305 RepID=UPI001C83D194|nr:zinc-binding dehydrogenase [Micromonospora tarapacensis]MBX7265782.1 zinc-binding dehydrogenase [Micromonospora tarapacensis]